MQKNNDKQQDESFLEDQKEVSLQENKGIFSLAKEDENGFVDMRRTYEDHPEIKQTFVGKIRRKQEMVIDSISEQDLMSATLRDKATSAKALGEQALELEQGKPMGNVQVFYIKAR